MLKIRAVHILSLLSGIILSTLCRAQLYTDVALDHGIFFQHADLQDYGAGVSFYDFNKDGWDDLSLCQHDAPAEFFVNCGGQFEQQTSIPGVYNAKHLTWVDFDNDGDLDLFMTRKWDSCKLFECIGDWTFSDITSWSGINMPAANTQGASWADYDNDGDLDLYICNYSGIKNYLFRNDGDGFFSDQTDAANAGGGLHYSFQATFVDFDRDGWQDLFIVNDRTDSPNLIYRNVQGEFLDCTSTWLGYYYIYSMSNSIADYDNDADLDIFITNNPEGHLLHRNHNGDYFDEVASESGVSTYDHCWAGQWMDVDLDGWEDLHVCCSPFWEMEGQNKFFWNNQDGTFAFDLSPGFEDDGDWSHSSAIGDFNHDGVFDLFVSNSEPDVSELWESAAPENNYLKVSVEGTESNRDGIGSWIEIWVNSQYQLRYTLCGEGYLSQNSGTKIFGLGQEETIDSLQISWPSGLIEKYYNLEANQCMHIVEGMSSTFILPVGNELELCPNDSVLVEAPDFYSYLWSTGDTTQTLTISVPGEYWLTAIDSQGNQYNSEVLEVSLLPEILIEFEFEANLCFGDSSASLSLSNVAATGLDSCTWSHGANGSEITELSAGEYEYIWTDLNGCQSVGFYLVNDPPQITSGLYYEDISCFGMEDGWASTDPEGGTGNLLTTWLTQDPPSDLAEGAYDVMIEDENGCELVESFSMNEPPLLEIDLLVTEIDQGNDGSAGVTASGGSPPYLVYWTNGEQTDVIDELDEGAYGVWVMDDHGCTEYEGFVLTFTSVNELHHNPSLGPNPFSNVLQFDPAVQGGHLRVFDSSGSLIYETVIDIGQMDVSHWPDGLYTMILVNSGVSSAQRLVKRSY